MKLLIVDDEKQILNGLANGIDWKSIGITEIITAENGLEGLEKFESQKPQIILTDIRMAGINGIELAKKINSEDPFAKIIILSGYSEFSYAKEAFKAGVVDYLLKPVDIPELLEKVRIAEEKYIAEIEYRTSCIKKIVEKKDKLTDKENELCSKYCECSVNSTIFITLLESDYSMEELSEKNKIILMKEIKELASTYEGKIICANLERSVVVYIKSGEYAVKEEKKRIVASFKHIRNILINTVGISFSVAVSRTGKINEIHQLYKNAEERIKQKMYLGKGCFITTDIESTPPIKMFYFKDRNLEKYIERLQFDLCRQCIEEVFDSLKEKKITDSGYITNVSGQIINLLLNTLMKKGINVTAIRRTKNINCMVPIKFFIDDYKNWVLSVYSLFLHEVKENNGKKYSSLILKALEFIDKNYMNNISLQDAADYVGRSKNYFCHIFCEEMDMSFTEYQNKVRVEKAKVLLSDTDCQITKISDTVGFFNYKYFSKIFKKETGLTPTQFRSSFSGNNQ